MGSGRDAAPWRGRLWMLIVAGALVAGAPLRAATIALDPRTKHQTITGWEVVAWAAQEPKSDAPFDRYKDRVFDGAVNDVGITRVRVEFRAGVENTRDYWREHQTGRVDYPAWRSVRYATVNDNADPNAIDWKGFHFSELDNTVEKVVIPLKRRIEAKGERLHVSLDYVAFTGQIKGGGKYIHDDPKEYAELVLAVHLHLKKKYGLVPDSMQVLLEPDNVRQWNGTLLGRAIVAAGRRLEAEGFTPRFVAPSCTNMRNAITYFDRMVAVPGVLRYLKEYSYHRYGGVSDANLRAIVSRAAKHGLETSMLEWWSGANGYETLHKDLKLGMNSCWQQGVVAGPGTSKSSMSLYNVDVRDPANPVVIMTPKTRFTRLYYRFVRPGAVRISAGSDDGAFDPIAFVNKDGRYAVVVKAARAGKLSVRGLPAGTYGIKYATHGEHDGDLPDAVIRAGSALKAAIPAKGVITIYGKTKSAG